MAVQATVTGARREQEGVAGPFRFAIADATPTSREVILEGRTAKANATEPSTSDSRPVVAAS